MASGGDDEDGEEGGVVFGDGNWGFEVVMVLSGWALLKVRRVVEMGMDQEEGGGGNDLMGERRAEVLNKALGEMKVAAGVFAYLEGELCMQCFTQFHQHVCKDEDGDTGREGRVAPPEIHPDVVKGFKFLALGLGQLIAFRLADLKEMSAATCAKLLVAAMNLFRLSLRSLNAPLDSQIVEINKGVFELVEGMIELCQALVWKFMGIECNKKQEWGKGVKYLRSSLEKVNRLIEEGVVGRDVMRKGVEIERRKVEELFEKYRLENERIYYETEPELNELDVVQQRVVVQVVKYVPTNPPVIPVKPVKKEE